MHKWLVLAVAVLMAGVTVQGSEIENATTSVHPALVYQEDAGVPGDAPATCETVDSSREILPGSDTHGMLVDYDDTADALVAQATQFQGERVYLDLLLGSRVVGFEVDFDVLDADCGYSVFDPSAPVYEDPDDRPAESYEPGEASQLVSPDHLTDYSCNDAEWKVMLKDKSSGARPSSIYMEWTDGSWEYVALNHASEGTVSMYQTSSNLEFSLAKIEAVVGNGWDGWFKIAHGPCDVEDGEIPTPTETGEKIGSHAEWTATASNYIVVITLTKGVEGVVDDNSQMVIDTAMHPPSSLAVQCHHICTAAATDLVYHLEFDKMPDTR